MDKEKCSLCKKECYRSQPGVVYGTVTKNRDDISESTHISFIICKKCRSMYCNTLKKTMIGSKIIEAFMGPSYREIYDFVFEDLEDE